MTNKLALVVAVVLGVLSILGVRFYVEKIKVGYDIKVAPIDVPVAARDLKPGDLVTKGDIQIAQFPHAAIDALGGSQYAANETDKFENTKVVAPIKQGQVFQQYHFRQSSIHGHGLPPLGGDYRAITIIVNPSIGLAGMLRPGDKVDIVVTSAYEEVSGAGMPGAVGQKKKWKVTSTLAQKVDVLAVDNSTEPEAQVFDYTTVTLKLHPEDANRLVHAIHNGWLYQLLKLDDTASPTASTNTVFAEKEFGIVFGDIKAFFDGQIRSGVNGGQPRQPPR